MVNLRGYFSQGTDKEDGGNYLFFAPYYNLNSEITFVRTIPGFMSGKKCYIAQYVEGSTTQKKYFGPYDFNFGIAELSAPENWKEDLPGYINENQEEIAEEIDGTSVKVYITYFALGDADEDAQWSTSLPRDGFAANVYLDRVWAEPINAIYKAWPSILDKVKSLGGVTYKLNGRYAATTQAQTSDIAAGLKKYEGGYLFGTPVYSYSESYDSFVLPKIMRLTNKIPNFLPELNKSSGKISMTGEFDVYKNKQIYTPSIKTRGWELNHGYIEEFTAFTASMTDTGGLSTGRIIWEREDVSYPFRNSKIFGQYISGEPLPPSIYYGLIFASEAITVG